MEMLSPVSDDEREDGEIVDDDFEDISDYSIPSCGKSEYSKGLLRAISLSSISDSEDGERESHREKRYAYITLNECGHRKRKCRRRTAMANRKRRRESSISAISCDTYIQSRSRKRHKKSLSRSSSSDNSSDIIDQRTLKQLNKAVRIDSGSGDESHHKSLKDRLKRMIQPARGEVIDIDDDDDSIVLVDQPKTVSLDETMDKELEELRLQALKSAMLKKHMERKRRKEMMNNQLNVQNVDLTNTNNDKENTESGNIIATDCSEATKASSDHQDTIEDDLDIMRAMLLASMSKKITEDQPSPSLESFSSSPLPPEIVTMNVDRIKKSNSMPAIKLPPVKPLIIQLNTGSDSDTDSEYDQTHDVPADASSNKLEPKIQTSVEELLRKQREQFEAKLAAGPDNDKQDDLDKSFLKLLPKSQQQEYKLLKQKLLLARKSAKTNEAPHKQVKKIPSQKADNNNHHPKEKKERLQTKGKYRELAPIIKKVNAEVTARRNCEEHIKNLMEQLQTARVQLNAHQHRYTSLVVLLKATKKTIDLRIAKPNKPTDQQQQQQSAEVIKKTIPPVPSKSVPKVVANGGQVPKVTTSITIAEPIIEKVENKVDVTVAESVQVSAIEPITKEVVSEEAKLQDEEKTNEIDMDIDLDGKNEEDDRLEPLAYVSPLDKRENNNSNCNNPLQMLCPYELFGVCKDKNCTYNHCP